MPSTLLRLLPFLLLLPMAELSAMDWPPRWKSADGWSLTPALSVQYDQVWARGPDQVNLHPHGFRRQRAALTLASPGGHDFKLDYDFATGLWADVVLRVRTPYKGDIRLGQIKAPIGLEQLTSHRALTSLERSPATALLPGRGLGIEWRRNGAAWTLASAALGGDLDRRARGRSLLARGTRAWSLDGDAHRLHLGLAGGRTWPHSALRVHARPELHHLPLTWLDSGRLNGLERIDRIGTELAWDRGAVHVQAEWIGLRAVGPTHSLRGRGHYATIAWRPTGEARRYEAGIFKAPTPQRAWGAMEVFARIGRLDLDASTQDRRHGRTAALGVTWYLDASWRLQAQVGHASGSADLPRLEDLHGLRVHYQF